MDNTEKSVIIKKELNTIPPFRNYRSANLKQRTGKRIKFNLIIFTSILILVAMILLINIIESNIAIGFQPAVSTEYTNLSGNYYTVAYNNIFVVYKETFDVTVNILEYDSRKLTVPMLTAGEVISKYFSKEYLSDKYEVSMPVETVVSSELEISVRIRDWIERVVDTEVEFNTVYIDVQTIPKGQEVVVQTGENAQVTRTIRDKYLNGEYELSTITEEIVNVPAKDEIIYRGVGGQFKTPKGVTYEYSYYIDVTATAYGVDTGYGGDSEYTYTGKVAKVGVIAVDPEVIPLGSKLYVMSEYMDHGICYAEDIGSAIVGNHIDVHLGNDLEAQLAFGFRNARVYVLE